VVEAQEAKEEVASAEAIEAIRTTRIPRVRVISPTTRNIYSAISVQERLTACHSVKYLTMSVDSYKDNTRMEKI
jgi:hypothetical protein